MKRRGLAALAVVQGALAVGLTAGSSGCRDSGAGVRPGDDAAVEVRPDLVEKLPPPDVFCAPDARGGGLCRFNFCADAPLKSVAALAAGEVGVSGADSACSPGDICVAVKPTPDGNALQLTCETPTAGALAFGTPCARDPAMNMRCKNDSLCVEAPDAPGAPFCSTLCRVDQDCPAESYCVDYHSAALPNQSYALVGMCTPKAKLGGTVCTLEKDCPAGQGCVRYGGHSGVLVCKPGGAKSIGEACASDGECRGRECFDRIFRSSGGNNRTFCSGICGKNSDCGADQRCVRTVQANNGTPGDPTDDVVLGYCQTLFLPLPDDGCKTNKECLDGNRGDTCDQVHGLCYTKGAAIGGSCGRDEDCGQYGQCALGPRFQGGACVQSGCAVAATSGVDACPGTKTACAQRGTDAPVFACYEKCGPGIGCSRFVEGYVCGGTGEPDNICLFTRGS